VEYLILSVIAIAIMLLQFYLSTRKNRWLGLVLPSAYFILSTLLIIRRLATVDSFAVGNVQYSIVVSLFITIPTILLLAIYFVCRKKHKSGGKDT